MTGRLKGQMRQLEAVWTDQEQAKFAREFADALRVLDRLAETNERHAQTLTKKARAIEAYLEG